jgi:hypothetical protein
MNHYRSNMPEETAFSGIVCFVAMVGILVTLAIDLIF